MREENKGLYFEELCTQRGVCIGVWEEEKLRCEEVRPERKRRWWSATAGEEGGGRRERSK